MGFARSSAGGTPARISEAHFPVLAGNVYDARTGRLVTSAALILGLAFVAQTFGTAKYAGVAYLLFLRLEAVERAERIRAAAPTGADASPCAPVPADSGAAADRLPAGGAALGIGRALWDEDLA